MPDLHTTQDMCTYCQLQARSKILSCCDLPGLKSSNMLVVRYQEFGILKQVGYAESCDEALSC